MTRRVSIAARLHDLDQRSPAGFAIALHIRFTRPTYLFQTYAKRWTDHYSSAGLVMHDPVVHWGLQNVGRVRWADLEAIDAAGVLEQAKDFGLMNGIAIAVVFAGTRTIGGFARADRDFDEAEVDALEAGLLDLHRATAGLGQLSSRDRRALTELSIRLTH
jgi:LuxR family transcriptional regulator